MIQQTNRKIHFTEYVPVRGREKNTDRPPTVRVNAKSGTLNFNQRTIEILGLGGAFIKLYSESTKKIIGFTVHNHLTESQLTSKKYRMVKVNNSGQAVIGIKGIIEQFSGIKGQTYKCEVKKYVETEGILEKGTTYYYVRLENDDAMESYGSLNGVDVKERQ